MAHPTDWMHEARFGVMAHYLAERFITADQPMTPARWKRQIDALNVERFAQTIADTGARYVIFTLGQNSGYVCSPNDTYDRLLNRSAVTSRCSRRDLIADLARELHRHKIRLIVYSPSTAPNDDLDSMRLLRCVPPWKPRYGWGEACQQIGPLPGVDIRLSEFQRHWEDIHREWSLRWGQHIAGWWIDGCYDADRMYRNADEPNFASFADALKAGHQKNLVAFNPGVIDTIRPRGFHRVTPYEDYTAGECDHLIVHRTHTPLSRFIDGSQLHALSYLSSFWGERDPTPRFHDDLPVAYTRHINDHGGAVSWDVPVLADGSIPDPYLRQLLAIGRSIDRSE